MSANTPKICIILRIPASASRFSCRSSFTLPEHWVPFFCKHFHIGMRTPSHRVLLENVSDRKIRRKFLLRKGNRFRISVKEKRRTLFPVVSREISRTANIWIYFCVWPRVARSGRRKRPLETGVNWGPRPQIILSEARDITKPMVMWLILTRILDHSGADLGEIIQWICHMVLHKLV